MKPESSCAILLLVLSTIQKHISSLIWINCIIPVKIDLIDEVCNKSRGLEKGNMAGLGVGGYCEKIGEKKELDRFSTKFLSYSKGTCKI